MTKTLFIYTLLRFSRVINPLKEIELIFLICNPFKLNYDYLLEKVPNIKLDDVDCRLY
jgi:hypothetical protein